MRLDPQISQISVGHRSVRNPSSAMHADIGIAMRVVVADIEFFGAGGVIVNLSCRPDGHGSSAIGAT
ncbi:hypothetical protein SDC9_147130 [bioreactor metagenome]|uniref:Uncharacterized protein n=1 Tax=bioreactor metagenome TaxID=1076179 RepID=A0A645EEU4_9ZZZZ